MVLAFPAYGGENVCKGKNAVSGTALKMFAPSPAAGGRGRNYYTLYTIKFKLMKAGIVCV